MIKIENTEVVGWAHAIRGMRNPDSPGCLSVLLNVFLVFITGGLWLIWLIVKYLMRNS